MAFNWWTKIATGTDLEHMEMLVPIEQLPHGTRFKVVLTSSIPIAPLADLAGAEWVADRFYSQSGAILEDVEGKGWSEIVLHFRANAVIIWVFLGVLAAVFIWAWFSKVDIFAYIKNLLMWGAIGLVAVAAIYFMVSRRPRARSPTIVVT